MNPLMLKVWIDIRDDVDGIVLFVFNVEWKVIEAYVGRDCPAVFILAEPD